MLSISHNLNNRITNWCVIQTLLISLNIVHSTHPIVHSTNKILLSEYTLCTWFDEKRYV